MNQEKINDLLHKVMDIKHDTQQVLDEISSMDSAYEEQTGREQALDREVTELKEGRDMLEKNVQFLRDENERLKRNVEYDKSVARGWKDKYYAFKETLIKAEDPRVVEDENERLKRDVEFYTKEYNDLAERLKMEIAAVERLRGENYQLQDKLVEDIPNMPTIPKDVAIAIFREGIKQGVEDACCEIDNSNSIEIEESGYTGGFEVSFSQSVDLTDHIDTDWMRSKVGDYEEGNAIATLRGLCETKGFECRIHGIDEKKTPKIQ